MRSIEVGAGTVTITDETIQIDIGPFGALKRFYEQSRLIVASFIFILLLNVVVFIVNPGPFYHTLSKFVIVLTIIVFPLLVILPKLRNNIETASEIPHSAVDRVEYTTGSWLRPPKFHIIATYGTVTGVRPVSLAYRQLGEQQLADAKQAFEDAGITVVPADDTDDDDS